MNLNRLLDEWEDPLNILYKKEEKILEKGLVLNCRSLPVFKKNLQSLITFAPPTSRSQLITLVGYMGIGVYPDETLLVSFYHIPTKRYIQKSFKGLNSTKEIYDSLCETIDPYTDLNDVFVKIKIETLGNSRNSLKKRTKINDSDLIAKTFIQKFSEHKLTDKLKNFVQDSINEKNLMKMNLTIKTISDHENFDLLSNKEKNDLLYRIKKNYKKFEESLKIKLDYLDMLLDSTESELDSLLP